MPLRIVQFATADELANAASLAQEITGVAIAGGGTGYTTGDVLTVVGGEFEQVCTLLVTSETAGVIDGISVQREGFYTSVPGNPVAVTGGTGNNDATFNLTPGAAVALADIVNIAESDGRWYLFYFV